MKYVIIDQIKNGDLFTLEYDNKEDAIQKAEQDWNHLSDFDKKRRESYYVLESVNPDPLSADHFDGDTVKEWT